MTIPHPLNPLARLSSVLGSERCDDSSDTLTNRSHNIETCPLECNSFNVRSSRVDRGGGVTLLFCLERMKLLSCIYLGRGGGGGVFGGNSMC